MKYISFKFFKLPLPCLFFSLVLQSESVATTLKEALELAYKNSETVNIKALQRDFGSIDRDTAWFNILPQTTLSYQTGKAIKPSFNYGALTQSLTDFVRENNLRVPQGNNDDTSNKVGTSTMSVSATLPLSYWKIVPGIVVAHKAKSAKDFEYNEFLENFGLLFIQKYMDVIYYTKAKEVYSQMTETLDKKLRKVSIMNRYGTAKKDKVVMAEAQLYENKANEITTQSALEKAKVDYKIMTGEMPVDLEIPQLKDLVLPAKNQDEFVAMVLDNNSRLLKVKAQLSAQKANLVLSSMRFLPDAFFNYSYTDSKMGNYMNYHYHSIGIGVSLTINGSDNLLNNARKEYKNYRIADLNYALSLKEIEQDAGYSWDQYSAMVELVKATEKALKASIDSLKEVKVSVSTGTATFIDEMDIENQYLNANLNYLNAIKALTLSYYKLISLTGVGRLVVK